MDAAFLRARWIAALASATEAVEAASRAHTLSPDECSRERQRIAFERAWLDTALPRRQRS